MAARTAEEVARSRRRHRLAKGLVLGAAAVGLPALANALISRRVGRLPPPRWGRPHRYSWSEGEIVFQRLGEGPPVVLLHSLGPGHDSEQWRGVAERLASGHRVYAPDLLGWGRSDKPALPYGAELYVQLVGDFLRDVVGEGTAVIAAGLTAAYALAVAAEGSEWVRALGLVVPRGLDGGDDEPDLKDRVVDRLLRLPVLGTSALNLYTSHSGLTHHLRHEVFAAPERVDAALVERHWRASHQRGAQAPLAAYLAGLLDLGVEDLLSGLEVPVWLAWGRRSASPPVEAADLWLHHLDAELTVFEDCGSQPHAERPAAFCRALEEFLAGLPA
jgi:pimeloyl-ACP methyl ester carboxylesterase